MQYLILQMEVCIDMDDDMDDINEKLVIEQIEDHLNASQIFAEKRGNTWTGRWGIIDQVNLKVI